MILVFIFIKLQKYNVWSRMNLGISMLQSFPLSSISPTLVPDFCLMTKIDS